MPEVSGLYTGPTSPDKHARDIKEIEKAFFGTVNIDWLLSEMAERVPQTSELTIIDIGSGDGAFIGGLTDSKQVPEFLSRIQRRDLRARAIGFTDSPSPDQLYKPVEGFEPKANESIETGNYYFTLTASQTLKKFLEKQEIEEVNFFLASQSLMYVSANIFESTVDQMVSKLKLRGKALVWGVGSLTGPLPAFVGVDASELRGSNPESDAQILNLFIEDARISTEMPLLTLRSDWSETKTRIESLVAQFQKRQLVELEVDPDELNRQLKKFQTYQSSIDHFKKLSKQGFGQIDNEEAETAIRFYLQLHPALIKLREKQYQKQVEAKQSYIEQLKEDDRVKVKVLRSREPSGVDAFIMEKL